jgi:hypothetical protein
VRAAAVIGAVLLGLFASPLRAAKAPSSSSLSSSSTWAEVKAKAPKARTARRAAFLVFARSDRAALDERRQAAKAALALADGPRDVTARTTARLVLAELAAIAGDTATTKTQLQAARAEGRGLAWVDVDDDATALLRCLDLDAALATATAPSPTVLSSCAALAAKVRAAPRSSSSPPRGSVFAQRRALAEALADAGGGLAAALDDTAARARLRRRLASLGAMKGRRDTSSWRALALEVRAALWLKDGKDKEAALDLLRADRLRAQDPVVAVNALPPAWYASTLRTRDFCAVVEGRGVSCDAIEEQQLGGVTFVDMSRRPPQPFSPEAAQQTLADYDVLVQRCLKEGAKVGLTTQTSVQLEWPIGNDGLVRGHDLRPMRLRGTSVDVCLQAAHAMFRFAPYPGEMQHLRLEVEVGGEL